MTVHNISIGEEQHLLTVPSLVFCCVMILCLGFSAGLDGRSSCSGGAETQCVFPLSSSLVHSPSEWTIKCQTPAAFRPTLPQIERLKIRYTENFARNDSMYLKVPSSASSSFAHPDGSVASKATAKLLNTSANPANTDCSSCYTFAIAYCEIQV
ncbi:hypothetical protein DFH08DRAFT_870629 [Mycena albidolilacea]|uniref:Uncharacterized protein n=1 Tax=Mycena albidolilacea TaxID=1033008 RepID=A0AAD6ZYP4_9AGAR|nr:hypothetical protein DFH08DRAFT_870629 [Mycena albidolilacea]